MLKATFDATDPITGQKPQVPSPFLDRVHEAIEFLKSELEDVDRVFGAEVHWGFEGGSVSDRVKMELSAAGSPEVRVNAMFTPEDFRDSATMQSKIRPHLSKLGRLLSNMVQRNLEATRERTRIVLEPLLATTTP